ncbi:MAG: DNRLRE domain-containing protein [Planctomycetota bacterium]
MRTPIIPVALSALALASSTLASGLGADAVLEPSQDGTLFENDFGDLANGAGQHIFTGQTVQSDQSLRLRRAVLQFDIATAVPAGATITSATLQLRMNRTIAGNTDTTLHRVTTPWGEGTTDAFGQEGGGGVSTTDSSTWIHSFWPATAWTSPGGDFDAISSADAIVGGNGFYVWSSAELAADVQLFLDDPAMNNGWILIGNETSAPTAKRFDSREATTAANRPQLILTFDPPAGGCAPADVTTDGTSNGIPDNAITLSDFSFYLSLWATGDPAADITTVGMCDIGNGGDGVDLSDFSCYLSEWSLGCP